MKVDIFLYDSAGDDEKISLENLDISTIKDKQLVWINVLQRDVDVLKKVIAALKLTNISTGMIIKDSTRPGINNFENLFHFSIDSVRTEKGKPFEKVRIDFLVGRNFVVTVHEGDIDYFVKFRKREKGETQFGKLNAESFVATLLDLHIISYFSALEEIDRRVDDLDHRVLQKEIETDEFLDVMVHLRRDVSILRRWLVPHREVIYALSRADFQQIAASDSNGQYKMLNQHFESAVDAVENSREAVLSIFGLYATRSAQETNKLIRKLTFFTLIVGSLGVVAGIFGMNYQLTYFNTEQGFWLTVGAMTVIAATWTAVAKFNRWI